MYEIVIRENQTHVIRQAKSLSEIQVGDYVWDKHNGAHDLLIYGRVESTFVDKFGHPYVSITLISHARGHDMSISLKNVFVIEKILSLDPRLPDGLIITDAELEKILHPYPTEVEQIVEAMKKFGEWWKDDCDEYHLDDVKMYPCAIELLNILKPKENVKESQSEVKGESSTEALKSFEEIVKDRKEKNKYDASISQLKRHALKTTFSVKQTKS